MRLLSVVMALALLFIASACTGRPAGQPRTQVVEIQVDQVEVTLLKSLPAQVQIKVTGVVGDSCNSVDKVTQSRQGNQINVRITAIRTLGVPCLEYAKLYEEVINLEGSFEPGTYTVTVNGVTRTFTV